jgi:F-type H+-transporting ATPase subunit b
MIWLLAQDEHATEAANAAGGHADVMTMNWLPGVTTLAVFLVAVGILAWKVWPLILKGLDERERKIRETLAQADAAKAKADAALAEYQASLATARREAGEMIAKARADAKVAGEELRRRNEAELMELKQRATREIDAARQAAVAELHAEATSLAAAIAGKILEREITADDQRRLLDEALGELGRMQEV